MRLNIITRPASVGVLALAISLVGCSNGNGFAEETAGDREFLLDIRTPVPQVSGLLPGLQTVDFEIYLLSNTPAEKHWADMVENAGKYFRVAKLGAGALPTPAVALQPLAGFPMGRRVSVSFQANAAGIYVLKLDQIVPGWVPYAGLTLDQVKDSATWLDPRKTNGWQSSPVVRVVGQCPYPTTVRVVRSGPKQGWRVEFSEPLPPGFSAPPVPVYSNKVSPKLNPDVDLAGTVTPTVGADSPREVFVPAPQGAFSAGEAPPTLSVGPWSLPASLGLATPFVAPYHCAPSTKAIDLRADMNATVYNVNEPVTVLNVLWPQPGQGVKPAK
jgi:hypothetical protein